MIVECTNAKHMRGFTNSKKYKVKKCTRNTYILTDDTGYLVSVNKKNFKKKSWIYGLFL